jgi:hypothetical protein
MTDAPGRLPSRKRVLLAWWGLNLAGAAVLLAFALRG